MELIDKDALVAEIKRRIDEINQLGKNASYEVGLVDAYKIMLSFLDTLEVKKMDPDELKKELSEAVRIYKPTGNFGWGTLYNIAWHFYELGLKVKKGE